MRTWNPCLTVARPPGQLRGLGGLERCWPWRTHRCHGHGNAPEKVVNKTTILIGGGLGRRWRWTTSKRLSAYAQKVDGPREIGVDAAKRRCITPSTAGCLLGTGTRLSGIAVRWERSLAWRHRVAGLPSWRVGSPVFRMESTSMGWIARSMCTRHPQSARRVVARRAPGVADGIMAGAYAPTPSVCHRELVDELARRQQDPGSLPAAMSTRRPRLKAAPK